MLKYLFSQIKDKQINLLTFSVVGHMFVRLITHDGPIELFLVPARTLKLV